MKTFDLEKNYPEKCSLILKSIFYLEINDSHLYTVDIFKMRCAGFHICARSSKYNEPFDFAKNPNKVYISSSMSSSAIK